MHIKRKKIKKEKVVKSPAEMTRKERRAAFRKENGCSLRTWAYRWSQDL